MNAAIRLRLRGGQFSELSLRAAGRSPAVVNGMMRIPDRGNINPPSVETETEVSLRRIPGRGPLLQVFGNRAKLLPASAEGAEIREDEHRLMKEADLRIPSNPG